MTLELVLKKEKAFEMMSNAIEHHCSVDFASTQKAMYEDIKNSYFAGDDLAMKSEWINYQVDRYKSRDLK